MAKLDSLLHILLKHGGDHLTLHTGQAPLLKKAETPLKFFFPAFDRATLVDMLREVCPEGSWSDQATSPLQFAYSHPLGMFEVNVNYEPQLRAMFASRVSTVASPISAAQPTSTEAQLSGSDVLKSAPQERIQPVVSSSTHLPSHSAPLPHPKRDAESGFNIDPKHRLTPTKLTYEPLIRLIEAATQQRASDVHLSEDQPPVIRVHGKLKPLAWSDTLHVQAALRSLLTLSERERVERGDAIDRGVYLNASTRLRFNVYLHSGGWGAAIRILKRAPPALRSLNLGLDLDELIRDPHGLVIASGPTGSGKSTTLAALAQHLLEARGGLLISLEDPIEYAFQDSRPGVLTRQRELGVHVSSFAEGLRSALREDPDIILIGEMRDSETIKLALTAAETGHLVLSSLHSRSAYMAIERIIDSASEGDKEQVRAQLADSLRAVISQRLIPRRGGGGRVVATEFLRVTHSVASLIRDQKTSHIISAMQAGGDEGMILLERALAKLTRQQKITPEMGESLANHISTYQQYLMTQ